MADMNSYLFNHILIPKPDGSTEVWELTDQWRLLRTEPSPASVDHSHINLGAMSFTGDVHFGEKIYAGEGDANRGKTQTVTIPDVCTMTFKKGLLVDYEIIVPP